MTRKHVLVIDIEATCWRGKPPLGEQREVIEIGLCAFDIERGQPTEKRGILIKPQCSTISEFCTELTSITPEMAAQGVLFNEACTLLRRDYDSLNMVWASWGRDDRCMFEKQCADSRVIYPFGPQHHVDLRRLFAQLQRTDTRVKIRQVGLRAALELMDMQYEGTAHRGVDDAFNTARLLSAMVARYGSEIVQL